MFAGLGLPVIPLSGWRSKQRPREMDAFDDLSPNPPAKTQKRDHSTLTRLSKSVYSGVVSYRPTSLRPNHTTSIRQYVRSRRKSSHKQSSRDLRTNQSDQQCLISDARHECRLYQAERGRLPAHVMDEKEKAMSVAEYSDDDCDRPLMNRPDNCQHAQVASGALRKRLSRAATRAFCWH